MTDGRTKWIALDRDGTIIVDGNYLGDPTGVQLLDGVAEGLRLLAAFGYKFIVITNQSGVGRGFFTEGDMDSVNARVDELLRAEGVKIEGYYCCTHTPADVCRCRKPGVLLAETAARELGFDISDICCVVGDRMCDVDLAENLKTRPLLVRTGQVDATVTNKAAGVDNFLDAAWAILQGEQNAG